MIDVTIINILAPAFIAGIIISLIHVPLGIEVLKRGIIFLDLAVAQFAALGMIVFYVAFENHEMAPEHAAIGALFLGLAFALLCSIGLNMVEKYTGQYQEAIIGSTFVFAASLSILIMAGDPHSGEQMKDILAGQILWITWQDLFMYSPVFLAMILCWKVFLLWRIRFFYIAFALTIPFSVSLMGVYLVFASLILPALATAKTENFRYIIGCAISITSFGAGLIASYIWDIPSGPAIIIALFFVSGFSALYNKTLLS